MNKLILSSVTVLILLLLSGCGGSKGSNTTETSLSNNSTSTTKANVDADKEDEGEDEGSEGKTVDAKALFEVKCSGCHGWDEPGLFVSEGKNAALKGQFLKHPKRLDWTDTVKRMRTNGMEVTDEELETITKYLNQNWRA